MTTFTSTNDSSSISLLAIVAYRCQVAGVPTESIDIQVRYFSSTTEGEITAFLVNEPTHSYLNSDQELVEWPFVKLLALEAIDQPKNGCEVVGFITGASEFSAWSKNALDVSDQCRTPPP